jgi:hypothetical protein
VAEILPRQIAPQIISPGQSIGAKKAGIESLKLQIKSEEIKYLQK